MTTRQATSTVRGDDMRSIEVLTRDVDSIKDSLATVVDKVDKIGEFVISMQGRRVPPLRDIIFTAVAIGTLAGIIYAGASYWFAAEFDKRSKELEAKISQAEVVNKYERLLQQKEIERLGSYVQVKPALREWAAKAE